MSGPIRMQMGPAMRRLIGYIEEVRPILEAEQRTPEGVERLRILLVRMRRTVRQIDEKHQQWHQYILGLPVAERPQEEQLYAQFAQDERHVTEWLDEAKELVTEVEIVLAYDPEGSSDGTEVSEIPKREESINGEGDRLRRRAEERPGEERDRNHREEQAMVMYPKVPWPYFYGDILEWPVFWEAFQAAVGQRPISTTQKVTYLMMSLKGRAARVVRGYQPVGENYEPIVDALKRQFGNDKAIKEALQSELVALPPANESAGSLRATFEDVERICRQMESLGLARDDQNLLLMVIRQKFPRAVVLEALKMEKSAGTEWGITGWRKALDEIIALREEAVRCLKVSNAIQPSPRMGNSAHRARDRGRPRGNRDNRGRERDRSPQRAFVVQQREKTQQKQVFKCLLCNGMHKAANCRQVTDRMERVRILDGQKRCHRCLSKDHSAGGCSYECGLCGGQHNRIICPAAYASGANRVKIGTNKAQEPLRTKTKGVSAAVSDATRIVSSAQWADEERKGEVLLMAVPVEVFGGRDLTRKTTALVFFDSGSQVSLISERLVRKLSPPKVQETDLELLGIRQRIPARIKSGKYLISLQLLNGKREEVVMNKIDFIMGKLRRAYSVSGEMEMAEDQPDILIGMPEFWRFFRQVSPLDRHGLSSQGKLYKVETTVGQIVCGQMAGGPGNESKFTGVTLGGDGTVVQDEIVKKFWELEAIGVRDHPNECDDAVAMELFAKSVHKEQGRYVVAWPWKYAKEELPDNFTVAYRRFVSLMDKLRKSPDLLKWYDDHFREQLGEEIVEYAKSKGLGGYFMPHHVVVTPKKKRVVYDASAKLKGVMSLNDALYRGQVIMPVLPGLLIRFRIPKIAMWADIKSAFWTLQLEEGDREYTKFLWLKDVAKPISASNLWVLRFRRVPFGVISSPFLLAATVRHHLKGKGTPLAEEVMENIYVDNVLVGCESEREAKDKYEELKELFGEVKMELREFVSNNVSVNEGFPEEDRLINERPKVLGMKWQLNKDVLAVDFPLIKRDKVTRRVVLRELASVFDPLGWAVPSLLPAKLFLQKLWDQERKWDDKVQESERLEWETMTAGWRDVSLTCERRVRESGDGHIQLHAFVDASKDAYAAGVYLRWEGEGVKVNLLYARSRLKPRGVAVSIPRMELLGVLIGTRALKMVASELGQAVRGKYLWCDSKPVLSWIKSRDEQPRFVANRLIEIKQSLGMECRYVPTDENPADIATRGCTPAELKAHPLWWKGPPWLAREENNWPKDVCFVVEESPEEEFEGVVYPTASCALLDPIRNHLQSVEGEQLIRFERFSEWNKCVRAMARVLKVAKLWMERIGKRVISRGVRAISDGMKISAEDFGVAEKELFRQGQQKWEEYIVRGQAVRTFEDEEGIQRLFTRVGKSGREFGFNYPAVFPKKSPILNILARRAHVSCGHGKVDATLNSFLQEFWAPRMRSLIKKVVEGCARCKRLHGPAFVLPPMPPHPETRLKRSKPFEFVSLDYLGPSEAKVGGKVVKFWIVLLTCLTTRGVYLEPVFDLTSGAFLQVLRRFAARRGMPRCIMSDNATTFKCAAKVLKATEAGGRPIDELERYLAQNGIGWKFVPALSPWANALAERLVKVCKDAFRSSLGRMVLNGEEVRTVTAEVEGIMNSRPLTFVSGEAGCDKAIRPIDFINPGGTLGLVIPGEDAEEGDEEFRLEPDKEEDRLRAQWRRTGRVLDWFWERWSREYIQ